jgi:putative membrane protein
MVQCTTPIIFSLLACVVGTSAFSLSARPQLTTQKTFGLAKVALGVSKDDNVNSDDVFGLGEKEKRALMTLAGATPAVAVLFSTLPAEAAAQGAMFPVISALVAYVHYASLLVTSGCLVAERLLIKPDMSEEDQDTLTTADTVYGLAAVLLSGSGYLRVTEYGKGWDFYKYEPLFWVKLSLLGVMGASSFFPTTTIIRRAIEKRNNGAYPPMSEKLAGRMTSIVNAELLALGSIPLFATLMSRGVLYTESIPWQAGAGVLAVSFGGLAFKYVKEALTWVEDEVQ